MGWLSVCTVSGWPSVRAPASLLSVSVDQHSVRMLTAKPSDHLDSYTTRSPTSLFFVRVTRSVRWLLFGSRHAFLAGSHWQQRRLLNRRRFGMDRGFTKIPVSENQLRDRMTANRWVIAAAGVVLQVALGAV